MVRDKGRWTVLAGFHPFRPWYPLAFLRLFLAKNKLQNFLLAYVCLVAGTTQRNGCHILSAGKIQTGPAVSFCLNLSCRVFVRPSYKLVSNLHLTVDITPINPSEIGLMCGNLATWGTQLGGFSLIMTLYFGDIFQQHLARQQGITRIIEQPEVGEIRGY